MQYPPREVFVALTDRAWFDYLSSRSTGGHVDEVNFWLPRGTSPMKHFAPGEPIFFRLKKPDYAIAGYGFFAHFQVLDLDLAWQTFGDKNGDPSREAFFRRIGKYRGVDLLRPDVERKPIGCVILRDVVFWPAARWIPWGDDRKWPPNVVHGRTEHDPTSVAVLAAAIQMDQAQVPPEFAEAPFELIDEDERAWSNAAHVAREGQGTFRLRLMQAYGQCAITGEHTPIVLDGAHIQPYRGPRSNHPQNGLLLTKEFHALFDAGYVGVTPDLVVRVSERLRTDFKNGHRYYPYDGRPLVAVPKHRAWAPSRDALDWHLRNRFLSA
ncbi:MAG: HNH endonuclease [Myxococcales bacterium]|nr:HNH endonuclease [Myxococcales bacterium]